MIKKSILLSIYLSITPNIITTSDTSNFQQGSAGGGAWASQDNQRLSQLTNVTQPSQNEKLENIFKNMPERVHNLVIIHDIYETRHNLLDLPFPWNFNKNSKKQGQANLWDLLTALSSNQLILTTKSLWEYAQFTAQLFEELATVPIEELASKHYPENNRANFIRQARYHQPLIQKMHHNFLVMIGKKQEEMVPIHEYINIYTHLFYSIYAYYTFAIKYNYDCRIIKDNFLLFIPLRLQPRATNQDQPFTKPLYAEQPTKNDIWLGMHYSALPKYNYKVLQENFVDQKQSANISGMHLRFILEDLFIKKNQIQEDYKVYQHKILPNFNIFLAGHGSENMTAEVSTEIRLVPKKTQSIPSSMQTVRSSDYLEILKIFNNNIFTNSLTTLSCYPGGRKLKDTFDIQSRFSNHILDKLYYPIIIIGSSYASVYSNINKVKFYLPILKNKFYFSRPLVQLSQCNPSNPNPYYAYFSILNQELHPKTINLPFKKHPYLQAVNLFIDVLNESLQNYVLIKIPNTSWFTPATYTAKVRTISQAETLAQQDIIIPKNISTIILLANHIPHTLTLESTTPETQFIIPSNYLNQNYIIENLKTLQSSLHPDWFLKPDYIKDIQEPINIVIKNIKLNDRNYTNFHIFIFENLDATHMLKIKQTLPHLAQKTKTITGYIYTENPQKTFIAAWPSEQEMPSSRDVKFKPFNQKVAQQLIERIEQQAQAESTRLQSASIAQLEAIISSDTKRQEALARQNTPHEITAEDVADI